MRTPENTTEKELMEIVYCPALNEGKGGALNMQYCNKSCQYFIEREIIKGKRFDTPKSKPREVIEGEVVCCGFPSKRKIYKVYNLQTKGDMES